jgi:hypothetical protein
MPQNLKISLNISQAINGVIFQTIDFQTVDPVQDLTLQSSFDCLSPSMGHFVHG